LITISSKIINKKQEIKKEESRINELKGWFEKLIPPYNKIFYVIIKFLNEISKVEGYQMNESNLASVWAPTLIRVEDSEDPNVAKRTAKDVFSTVLLLADIIKNYQKIMNYEELEKRNIIFYEME
jgi:hypothetical protein